MNQEEKEIQALQDELDYRRQPPELNPQILQNVFTKTGLEPDRYVDSVSFWTRLSASVQQFSRELWKWKWTSVTSVLVVSVALVVVIKIITIPPELEPRLKSPSSLIPSQTIVDSNPQVIAHTLKADLAKLGMNATIEKHDNIWIVEVANWPTDRKKELSTLLKKYKLELPAPGESGLKVKILAKDH